MTPRADESLLAALAALAAALREGGAPAMIIGGLALVLGSLLGERTAQVMGLTRSFLLLENRAFLPTTLSWSSLRFGVIALIFSLLASIVPAINASRDTVVTYKQEQARSLRAPFWQRAFLDVFLLVPALYGYYLLKQRGTIAFLETGGDTGSPLATRTCLWYPCSWCSRCPCCAYAFSHGS